MAISQNYPSITPSLNLDFAKSKFLDPRITFTRASVGTYVGADGLIKSASSGAARFTHNPFTGESLGLLIEEGRTNIRTYSSSINASNAYRIYGTPSYNTSETKAPDGTNTATKITGANAAAGFDTYGNDYGFNQGVTQTYSVFVKNVNATSVKLGFFGEYVFTFATETGSGTGGFEKYPNGWYRIWATVLKANQYWYQNLYMNDGAATTDSIYVWGAQNENASFPTSYIPTTSASVTRAADTVSISGTNFSSWYSQDKGTILYSYRTIDTEPSAYSVLWELRNGGARRLFGYHSNSSYGTFSPDGGSTIGSYSTPSTYVLNKAASAYSSTTVTSTANGANPGTGSHTLTATQDRILFGSGSDAPQTHCVSNIVYYPAVLTSNQIQTLTK